MMKMFSCLIISQKNWRNLIFLVAYKEFSPVAPLKLCEGMNTWDSERHIAGKHQQKWIFLFLFPLERNVKATG